MVAVRPVTCARISAQNSSWMEREAAATTRTARERANTSEAARPTVAPSPTPMTAKATVRISARSPIAATSGRTKPAPKRARSAHGCSAVTWRSASAAATAARPAKVQVTVA